MYGIQAPWVGQTPEEYWGETTYVATIRGFEYDEDNDESFEYEREETFSARNYATAEEIAYDLLGDDEELVSLKEE